MGANPKKTAKAKKGKACAKVPKVENPEDAMDLVLQAEEVFAVGDLEQAQELMNKALTAAPSNPSVLTAFGSMLAEAGNTEKAILTLQKAIKLAPDTGFEKYMARVGRLAGERPSALRVPKLADACRYLGQLLGESAEAEAAMTAGMDLLRADISDLEEHGFEEDAQPLRAQLCSALCGVAELRMARAGDLADVEVQCEAFLSQAAECDPSSPEPQQALASLRYEQGRADEALATLRVSMAKWWKPPADEGERAGAGAADGDDEDGDEEGDEEMDEGRPSGRGEGEAAASTPSYEFRFECAKLLIELDESTDVAIEVLEDLLAEYDDTPDTWHLLSLAYYGGGMFEEATETLEYGRNLLQKLQVPRDSEVACMYDELRERIDEALKHNAT